MIPFLVLCALLSDADSVKTAAGEQGVLAAYKRMEEADRNGDGRLWFALRDRKTLDTMPAALKESIRQGGRSRPAVRYEPLTVRVRGERAILLGRVVDPVAGSAQYQSVSFVVEGGDWKVSREQWSDAPFDPFVLYGFLPPDAGAFARAGSPWKKVPYASPNLQILGKKDAIWKMQATYDESFLYIRYEWIADVPAPGARVKPELADAGKTGGPPPPPPMRIKAGRELTVSASDMVSTRGNRSTVSYSLLVKNAAGEDIFDYSLGGDSTGHLLSVQDRFVEIRVPLGGLGIDESAKAKIQLEESDAVMRLLPYAVSRF